ncbi:ATP-dependent DNA helicase MER3 [Sporothrix stenoceras]
MAPPTPRYSSPSPLAVTTRAPIQPRHNPVPQVNGIQLISPQAIDKRFQAIFPYEHFNAMQSSCFSCVYGSSYNVVVAAPTGSGKTVVFELAICKLLASRDKKDFKIVYQAPTKALCSERARDWQNKFKPLGLQVAEFTGDTSAAEVWRARMASVIITTPEKWDSITRKWSDHGNLLKTVKLVLIDEVHILKDTRGATLETVVSRMKTLGSEVRFVALSATIPNSTDIAQWLGLTYTSPQVPAKTFVCGEEFRPVRLDKIVVGYNMGGGNEHSLDSILDDQLPDLIVKHAQGKPVLIFCFTRKSTESAASALAEYWGLCPDTQKPWLGPSVGIRSSARLQNLVTAGVAFHHGGLERQDLILKGTMGYQNGKFSEYDEFEVMQMIGRAGRPQFDTSATAIILTRAENKEKYKNIESGCQTVESTLHLNLIEHLNSEIVLGTITSLPRAVQWLRGTFLAVRLRQNPNHYKLTDETSRARTTDEQLEEICKAGIDKLAEIGLIKYQEGSDTEFRGTPYGSAMSTYMVRFGTMVMMLKLEKSMNMEELLCQVPDIGPANMKKLVDKNITTVLDLADLGPVNIERFLNKNPPAAMKIADALRTFPRLVVDGHVAKAQDEDGIQNAGTGVNAVARVKFGCMNEDEERPEKRQRLLNYSTHPITVGGTVIDCVDLSTVDETDGGPVQSPSRTNNPPQVLMSGALSADSGDSFSFQNVPTRIHYSGGGTRQDPLTLDDSGSDDYDDTFDDTTIFDNIELPAIKESPTHKPSEHQTT